ncbi:Hypothetical protein A7982_03076 [Minicystis rosea]|nr:Hypothetical protein A7982_03076 [Minicystis rosea]
MRLRSLAGGILLVGSLVAVDASAGPAEDRAAADTLFREGRALVKQGKYADGCPKLAASQKLDPAIGTLLALGDCYELAGQTASAWATFNDAGAMARKAGDQRRGDEAARRAGLLEPKLSKLVIEIAPDARAEGLEVRRNGKTIDTALLGAAIPIDPGEQTIEATAPNRKPWVTKVQVEAKPGAVTVRVPALAVAPAEVAKQDPPKGSPPPPRKALPRRPRLRRASGTGSASPGSRSAAWAWWVSSSGPSRASRRSGR